MFQVDGETIVLELGLWCGKSKDSDNIHMCNHTHMIIMYTYEVYIHIYYIRSM